jgi:hypothetical protein
MIFAPLFTIPPGVLGDRRVLACILLKGASGPTGDDCPLPLEKAAL